MAGSTVEQELHKEVEDLKLRLQMAAEHYKDKYKDCQKLQKQVTKLTEQLVSWIFRFSHWAMQNKIKDCNIKLFFQIYLFQ